MFAGECFASPGHPQSTYELLHVEEGELTLTVDAQILTVTRGSSAVAKTAAAHSYANLDDQPLVFTMAVAEIHY